MKICVLTHTFPRFLGDPVAPFMKYFCLGLTEQKQNVTVLAPYDDKFKTDYVPNVNIKLYKYAFLKRFHLLGYSRTLLGDQKLRLFVYPLAPLMFLFGIFALVRLVRKERIDIISAHWIIPNGFIAAIASAITGTPFVITVPGSDVYLAKKNAIFQFMTKYAAGRAKIIASNSIHYLEELNKIGISSQKFIEIPYGVDITKYTSSKKIKKDFRKKLGFSDKDFIILAVGRLVEKKGFVPLIKAFSTVVKEKKDAKLVIIGDGNQKATLEKLVEDLRIKQHLYFFGKIKHDELPNYYTLSDMYVASSIRDSKGNLESHIVALFEAIASSLPIVATNLAVSSRYVVDGKNGFRVKDKNEAEISRAILKIINTSKKAEMGKYSREIAKRLLSYHYTTSEYINVFKKYVP